MKTFGKILIGLGTFTAGLYAGTFISAYVAEKVMDSPLDESVLRKHNQHKNESKLNYMVFEKPKNWDNQKAAEEEFEDWVEDDYGDNGPVIADYKGSVKTFADLPKEPDIGDYFLVEDADNGKGCIYTYTKKGYVIPEIADDVSLNDLFSFKKDLLRTTPDSTDTDSDTVPTYYESLESFLNDDQIVCVPLDTKVHIKMKSGNVVEYRRIPGGWARSSRLPASADYIAIHYGELNDDIAYDLYNPHNGDYLLGVSADAKTFYSYRWSDACGLYCYDVEDKTSPYLPDSKFASDESDDDESTYYDSLNSFLNDLNELYSTGEKVHIKMKDGVVLQYVRTDDGWVLDPLLPDPKHISGIFYGDINLVDFHHYTFHEGGIILNIPFTEDASEKAKLYKWHNGEITNTGIMIDRSDEDGSYDDNDIIFADYKGSVKTFDNLPKDPEIGDTFLVEDADNGKGCIYTYTKHGYVIPNKTDGVSLNDIFKVKKDDAPQDDTDSDITAEESNS